MNASIPGYPNYSVSDAGVVTSFQRSRPHVLKWKIHTDDEIQPAIEQAYTTGQVRPLLQIEG